MATVAIASLVMVALVSFLSVVSKVFIASAIESEQRLIASSAKAYLKNELTYAENVTIININELTYNTNQKLEFIDGKIYKNDIQVFDNEFYGNTKINISVTGIGSVLTFTLDVINGETVRNEDYVVKTLNSN